MSLPPEGATARDAPPVPPVEAVSSPAPPPVPLPPSLSTPAGPPSTDGKYGSLRASYRILLHIAQQGHVHPEDLPPRGLTQAGMIDALGIGQGVLAGPLQRLVLAGALSVERGHAQGVDRRVKIYRLTPLGERIVRDLRARRRPPSRRAVGQAGAPTVPADPAPPSR